MRDGRKVVFLLHGVDPDLDERGVPAWYAPVRRELEAFYDVVELRYRRYDRFGKVLLTTFGGAPIAAILIAAFLLLLGRTSVVAVASAIAVLLIGCLACAVELFRRNASSREVAGQLGNGAARRENHLIAHSFGTFLFPRAARRAPVPLQHVILTGCVLSRRFDWEAFWHHRGDGVRLFQHVRNECSTGDRIARWAGLATLLTGLGDAGARGFLSSDRPGAPSVHNVNGPWGPCRAASAACRKPPVIHNLVLHAYGHDGVFLSGVHARNLWLPTFWSYDPLAFSEFVIRCGEILEQQEQHYSVREMYDALADEPFPWFSMDSSAPKSIRAVVEGEAGARGLAVTPDRLALITQRTCESMVVAWQQPDIEGRMLAYPRQALGWSMKKVLEF